jgi:hypothetical protein
VPIGGLYPVDCEAAQQAADAIGICEDLSNSITAFERLRQAMAARGDPGAERDSYISGITLYARCFLDGRRYRLAEKVFDGRYAVRPDTVQQHRLLMDLADKDLRHPVSGFEQSVVGVMIAMENGRPVIVSSGALHARHHLRIPDRIDEALEHVRALRDHVLSVAQERQREVERVARSMAIGKIIGSGPATIAAPEISKAGVTRKGAAVTSIPGLD